MQKQTAILLIFSLVLLTSCMDKFLGGEITVSVSDTKPEITRVKIENDQLIVTGSNLSKVTNAKIEGSTNHTFDIESKSESQLVLNAKSALSILVGQSLNLIVSNAQAAATFPISFELQNGQVTAAHLNHMGASAGQVLRFNGTNWAPANATSSQIYAGTYNATTDSPDIVSAGGSVGTYYIVTTAGSQDLGNGVTAFDIGDWIIFNGTTWDKVAIGGNTVSNFNGRTGAVVPLAGDYSWSMLTKAAGKLTGSTLSEIADVDVTGIQDGDILQWNVGTSKWEVNAVPAPSITAGSITNSELANSAVDSNKIVDGSIVNADISATAAIAQSKIQNLTTDLSNKEPLLPTSGTTAQYLRGNKTLATLDSAAVPENGNLYFTPSRVLGTLLSTYATGGAGSIAVTDTIPQALSKLETKTNSLSNYVLLDGSVAMTDELQMGTNKITGLGAPTVNTDAATKAYVDSVAGSINSSQWSTSGSDISYNTGKVGIGTNTPDTTLHVLSHVPAATPHPNRAGLIIESEGASFGGRIATRVFGNDAPYFMGYRALGDKATPTALTNGKIMLNIFGHGFDGTDWSANGSSPAIQFETAEAWSATNKGSRMVFSTVANGTTTTVENMAIENTGDVSFTKKVRLKSDNANYVELKAPAALAATLTFNLPGTYGTANQVLMTDGAGNLSWTAAAGGGAPTGPASGALVGNYPNPTLAGGIATNLLANGTIDNTEFQYINGVTSNIQAQLNSKEASLPTGGTTLQYFRGDKTLATLNTTVVPEGTNEYFTQGKVRNTPINGYAAGTAIPLATTDTVLEALGKLEAQNSANATALSSTGQWGKNGSDVYYTAGKIGIGLNNPATALHIRGGTAFESISADASGNGFSFWKSRNYAATEDGDELGYFNFFGHDGTGLYRSAYILAQGDGTPSAGSVPGSLSFHTTTAGDGNSTEKMRITSDGYVGIGNKWPGFALDINSSDSFQQRLSHYSNSDYDGAAIMMVRGRGTYDTSTAVLNDNTIGGLYFRAWDGGNASTTTAAMEVMSTENHDAVNKGSKIFFETTQNGSNSRTQRMVINHDGNVGVGVTGPNYKLDINGDVNIANASALRFAGTQVCTSAGCTSSSDRRLKENINPLVDSLNKILKLQGVEYDYIDKKKFGEQHQVGVIAQEVEKIFPEVVKTDAKTGLKSVAYDHLVAPIIEAIKELHKKVMTLLSTSDQHSREIASIKEENKQLKNENAVMKTYLCAKDPKASFCK